jgi:hypothetical protein
MEADDRAAPQPPELGGDTSRILLEAVVSLLRQQDSDLRMLALVESAAEDESARAERIVDELARHHPSADRSLLRQLVDETTAMYFERIARAEDLEAVAGELFTMAASLSDKLAPDADGAALAGHLVSACADTPDSTRMFSTLLMGSIAAFEGHLAIVLRMLASVDPAAALSKGREAQGFDEAHFALRADRDVFDAIDKVTKAAGRGGWEGWIELFRWFGIAMPDQPDRLAAASRLRNAIAHTNGYVASAADAEHARGDLNLESVSELTPEYLRHLLDAQIHVATALAMRILDAGFREAALSTGDLLGKVHYELLVRHRNEAIASAHDLHGAARFADDGEERNLQVNEWLALKRLGRRREYMHDLSHWGPQIAGSVHDVARAVLMNRPVEAKRLAQHLRGAGVLGEREWQTWPLFDEMR